MSLLINSLLKQFPHEQTPFGNCIIIPNKLFLPEWDEELKGVGHKVFLQSWNGQASAHNRANMPVTETTTKVY